MPRMYTLDWYLSIRHEAPKTEIAAWASKMAMRNFFLYKNEGKRKVGKCTACKTEMELRVGKNRYTDCPTCGQKIKAVENKDFTHGYDCFVSWLDRYDGFFLNRTFRVFRRLYPSREELHIEEAQMQVFGFPIKTYTSGYSRGFSRETSYKNSNWFTMNGGDYQREHREYWERGVLGGFGYNIYQAPSYVYPVGLRETLKGTPFEYSALWELAEHGDSFSMYKALLAYAGTPQLEYLIKLKMYKLAKYVIRRPIFFRKTENDVVKFLGLKTCSQMQFVIDNNLSGDDFYTYCSLVRKNLPITEHNMRLMKLNRCFGGAVERIFEVMSAESFFRYFEEQKKKGSSLRSFCQDYLDHMRIVKALGLDINNTMYSKPKDFSALHNALSTELSAIRNKEKYEKVKKTLRSEKSFAFSHGAFCLIVPKTANEIVMEGKNQEHCVGTYLDRVADKKSVIVFIRRAEELDKAFYTMEINPETMKVVQCRGRKNSDMTPEVRSFVELYTKFVLDKKRKKKAA